MTNYLIALAAWLVVACIAGPLIGRMLAHRFDGEDEA